MGHAAGVGTGAHDDEVDTRALRWADDLAAWAIPPDILERAPESPWGFPTELFRRAAAFALVENEPTPSRRRALEGIARANRRGGRRSTVLDVGAGAGAASLPLAPPAARIVAVDESQAMLDAFRAGAAERRVAHGVVLGRWPDVAPEVGPADVVVCHHVLYNVADIVPFVTELARHARHRVVIEITASHPQSQLNPLWRELHGIERPASPDARDVEALLAAMRIPVQVERFSQPPLWGDHDRAAHVAFARRRLCLGPHRDDEIDRLLTTPDRRLVTLWWDRQR